ncbi:MAG TPA: Hsp20/alpha crystallin family protein [Spirochaetota bacterium]|nr:Hsp20/alpha crystallin family protein [Spirochaetota bacterium]HPS87413.1 Hsp20/alpha crystallin family protein [Spirochaetota bacterium]
MKFGITRKTNNSMPELRSFRNDVNRLFDDFFNLRTAGLFDSEWLPALDVYDDEKNFYIKADVAGIDEKNLDVTINGNVLTLSGKKVEEKKDEGKNYIFSERRAGSFSRSLTLPSGFKQKSIKGELKNGVLTVTIEKDKTVKDEKIKIDVH